MTKSAAIFVDAVIDRGLGNGAVILLAGDRLVLPKTLTEGAVLTHRLNDSEVELEVLSCVGTIWQHSRGATTSRGAPPTTTASRSSRSTPAMWAGMDPRTGSATSTAGDLLAVRVDNDGAVHIERLDADPAPDRALVERLRRSTTTTSAEAATAVVVHGSRVRAPRRRSDSPSPARGLRCANCSSTPASNCGAASSPTTRSSGAPSASTTRRSGARHVRRRTRAGQRVLADPRRR